MELSVTITVNLMILNFRNSDRDFWRERTSFFLVTQNGMCLPSCQLLLFTLERPVFCGAIHLILFDWLHFQADRKEKTSGMTAQKGNPCNRASFEVLRCFNIPHRVSHWWQIWSGTWTHSGQHTSTGSFTSVALGIFAQWGDQLFSK